MNDHLPSPEIEITDIDRMNWLCNGNGAALEEGRAMGTDIRQLIDYCINNGYARWDEAPLDKYDWDLE